MRLPTAIGLQGDDGDIHAKTTIYPLRGLRSLRTHSRSHHKCHELCFYARLAARLAGLCQRIPCTSNTRLLEP